MSQSHPLPSEFLKKLLKSILKKEGLDNGNRYDVSTGVDGNQDNWMTSVYRVVVYPDNNNITKRRSLFFKCLPASTERSEALQTTVFFKNEILFYDQVLPALLDFQLRRKATSPFRGVPKCYSGLSDGKNDVLVMEDLQARGYVMLDRLVGMGIDEVRMMMEQLGRFHALSLAMKDQDLDGFSKAKSSMKEVLFTESQKNIFGRFFEAATQDALKLVQGQYPPGSPYVTRTQSFVDEVFNRMTKLSTPDTADEQFNVMTHGDLWINNFLFRYKDNGTTERVDRMCFLDFQVCRYASLGLDLACALYLSMDQQTRVAHRDDLLHSYHKALSLLLRDLGSDPEKILPFDVLETLLLKYGGFGVGMACLNLPIQMNEGGGSEDSADEAVGGREGVVEAVLAAIVRKPERCKQRIVEVIKDAVDRGYLQ